MNLSYIPHRLEIKFWSTFVLLSKEIPTIRLYLHRTIYYLTQMKRFPYFLMLLIVPAGCLVVGLLTASYLAQPEQLAAANVAAANPVPSATHYAPNGQRNILLIAVDNLELPTPRLEGLWLALYVPPTPHITLLHLFPASVIISPDQDASLANSFQLGPDRTLGASFVSGLHELNLWWNNYILIDRIALAELIELTGGVDLGQGNVGGTEAMNGMPHAWDNPQAAMHNQTNLLRNWCINSARLSTSVDPAQVFVILANHLMTDFKPEELLASKEIFRSATCEFPTWSQTSP